MDYLFQKELAFVPVEYEIVCYYIVDNHLMYTALSNGEEFYLHYVDSDTVGERIMQSTDTSDFDYFVIMSNQPIVTQCSCFEEVYGKKTRVVRTRTLSGNPLSKKPKPSSERTIINRYKTNRKKLF